MHWIGVVASKQAYDRLESDAETWWCLPKQAGPGDDLLVYVASKVQGPGVRHGIVSLHKVTALDPAKAEDCRRFGGGYLVSTAVQIALVRRFQAPLALRTMKTDAVIAGATCVRRSFQSTCFEMGAQEFRRTLGLLKRANEDA